MKWFPIDKDLKVSVHCSEDFLTASSLDLVLCFQSKLSILNVALHTSLLSFLKMMLSIVQTSENRMNFYGFDRKQINPALREECLRYVPKDVEKLLHDKIFSSFTNNYEKEYVFAMSQFLIDEDLSKRIKRIQDGEFGWNHPELKDDVLDVDEMRDYIKTPLEVEEGVITCKKCNSKRVFSYQKQTRGCDESSTTFARCAKCGQQWSYSG